MTSLWALWTAAALALATPLPPLPSLAPLPQLSQVLPGVLSLPLQHVLINTTLGDPLARSGRRGVRRDVWTGSAVDTHTGHYMALVQFGTPGDAYSQLSIDTGSWNTWVFTRDHSPPNGIDLSHSSTFKLIKKDGFTQPYGDGSYVAKGDLVQDTVTVQGGVVPNQQFGLCNFDTDGIFSGYGVLALNGDYGGNLDGYFVSNLKKSGAVQRIAYSLFLNDAKRYGELTLGGLDPAKFDGKLIRVPFAGKGLSFVSATVHGATFDAILDSGGPYLTFPQDQYNTVLADLKAAVPKLVASNYGGLWQVDSLDDVPSDGSGVTVTVGGTDFIVPWRELFEQFQPNGAWIAGLENAGTYALGVPFLRTVYCVFDLEARVVGMAYAKFTDASAVVPIPGSGIPDEFF